MMDKMRRRTHRAALQLLMVCAPVAWAHSIAAQARPEGQLRPWIELGLGGARQDPHCANCAQRTTMGGPTATAAIGLTVTRHLGFAVVGRAFSEFSFDNSHSATYYLALAQYSPAPPLTLNAGLGTSAQHGDDTSYGDNGTGAAVAAGVALRLPAHTTFGLALDVDWIKTVSGTRRTASGLQGSSYRPMLFTIGLGLSIAGDPIDSASAR